MKKLILVGAGETAQTIYHYFNLSDEFQVEKFTVEERYIDKDQIFGADVLPYEEIQSSPGKFSDYYFFVAVSYTDMNRVRERFVNEIQSYDLRLCSYIHPSSFIAPAVNLGINCFVYDNCSINYGVTIADNTTICSGSVISHSSKIGANVFIAPNSSIGGFTTIGDNAFIGIGSTISDMKNVSKFAIVSAGAAIFDNADAPNIYKGNPAKNTNISSETYLSLMKGIS